MAFWARNHSNVFTEGEGGLKIPFLQYVISERSLIVVEIELVEEVVLSLKYWDTAVVTALRGTFN